MKLPKQPSPLEKAKDNITISSAGRRLDLDIEMYGDGSYLSPLRPESRPSFSVYADDTRWKDFGTDEGGDVVDFVAQALAMDSGDPSDLDPAEAAKLIIKWDREGPTRYEASIARSRKNPPSQKPVLDKYFEQPSFRDPLPGEIEAIRINRDLKNDSGIQALMSRGMLKFCDRYSVPCWCLLDDSGHNAQVRPVYPNEAQWEMKSITLAGSAGKWPIGLPSLEHCSRVLICEGPPDLLAVTTVVCIEHPHDLSDTALLAKTGISKIPQELLDLFIGKRVRYFAHNDTAGLKAATEIATQLGPITSHFDHWVSEIPGEDFNDYASRLWKLNQPITDTQMA